jgi:hypothetical protein
MSERGKVKHFVSVASDFLLDLEDSNDVSSSDCEMQVSFGVLVFATQDESTLL